jgi:hypothetical protein
MRGSLPSDAALFLSAFALAGLLVSPGHAQTHLEKLEAKFDREPNPVKKAKTLTKLGREEFEALRAAIHSGNIPRAASLAERYRDQARTAHAALAAAGINAEKKPQGFQQLQISVRESIFDLRSVTATLPLGERAPFTAVAHDLDAINQELLHELFPRPQKNRAKKRR